MSSDNHASYARIGLTVVLGVVAIVGTLVYLGGLRGQGDEELVETYYDKPVNGLSVGSDVNFRGVKIGEVREISFVGEKYKVEGADNSRIYILMAFKTKYLGLQRQEQTPFGAIINRFVTKLGLRATVAASGITGMSRIECDFNVDGGIPETPAISWTPDHPYVPPKISLLDSFGDSATKVMNQINKMDLNAVWSNMSATVESLSAMSESTRNLIDSRRGAIDKILSDVSEATTAIKDLAERVRDNPSLLLRDSVAEPLPETRH